MIVSSLAVLPYSSNFPAPSKPRAQKESGAPENGGAQEIDGERKNTPEAQLARQDPAKASQEKKQIDELKKIDRAVRAHERAHLAAAGGLAVSGATFSYRRGPDGQQYAVGGEVSIDASPGRTPEETIDKARNIQAAALAPVDPSAQDRAVAARATQMKLQAEQELSQEKLAADAQRGIASYRANSGAPELASGGIVNSAA